MRPGPPALCRGMVTHRRTKPERHAFAYDVTYVWFDPDRPESLTDKHWAWSTGRFRPARIAAVDYGWPEGGPIVDRLEPMLREAVGEPAVGAVRLLTQPRRWGWLFNPISLYLVWSPDRHELPSAAVLEVTNTPWKERHHYPVALVEAMSNNSADGSVVGATFDKDLHVSPFLPMDMTYRLQLSERRSSSSDPPCSTLIVEISVVDGGGEVILETAMTLDRCPATAANLAESLRRDGFATHRTSAGIHNQAARLLAKGVSFVPHPKRSAHRGPTQH